MPASSVTLLGVPYDAASSFLRGPAEAPRLIREALHSPSSNLWTETGVDLGAPGILGDAGDVDVSHGERIREDIEAGVRRVLDDGAKPLALGGDHSVSHPLIRAAHRRYPALEVLHFDAHADLYDEFEGDRHSHACPFARVMEEGLARRLVQVGIRTMNGHQREQADRFGVEVIEMRHWRNALDLSFDGPLYISVDVDVLDPAFAPGISHRESGGCSMRQLVDAIQSVRGDVVAADVVEYNPRADVLGVTAMAAAKLVKELAARMLAGPR